MELTSTPTDEAAAAGYTAGVTSFEAEITIVIENSINPGVTVSEIGSAYGSYIYQFSGLENHQMYEAYHLSDDGFINRYDRVVAVENGTHLIVNSSLNTGTFLIFTRNVDAYTDTSATVVRTGGYLVNVLNGTGNAQ